MADDLQTDARRIMDMAKQRSLIAITGVAGPEPDEDGNPVGLVYVAVASRDGTARVVEHRLGNAPKGEICQAAMRSGISLLEEFISAQRP